MLRGPMRSAALLVAAAAVLWSTGAVGVKTAVAEPLVVAGLRSGFAFVFMGAVLAVVLARDTSSRGWADVVTLLRRPLLWGSATSYAVMVVMFVLAARRTTGANASFLQYAAPIYVALLSGPLLDERVGRRDVFAVGLCVLGMSLAFGGELEAGKALGNALAVVSGFGFAGLPLLLRLDQKQLDPRLARHAPLVSITLGNALAALVAVPAILAHPPEGPGRTQTWLVIFLLGNFQIGLPYVLYSKAVSRLRALESALIATIEPVLTPVWVVLATGERPSPLAALGGVAIVGAVVVQAAGRARAVEPSPEPR